MFKRLFWVSIGVGIGVVAVTTHRTPPANSCLVPTRTM